MAQKQKQVKKQTTRNKGKKPEDLRSKIKKAIETIEQTWVDVSLMLVEVYENEKYKEWGFETFEDYSEEELGMSYRSAMYRVQLGKAIREYGLDADKIKKVGWTRIKEVLPLIEKAEGDIELVDEIVKKAEENSVRTLRDYVKRVKEEVISREDSGGQEIVKKVRMSFQFLQDQADIVERAIQEAMQLANTENKAQALEYICGEWLESLDGVDFRNDEDDEEEIELE